MTELGDLINTLFTGHGSMDMPLTALAAVWIVAFLIPEALAAQWGVRTAIATSNSK